MDLHSEIARNCKLFRSGRLAARVLAELNKLKQTRLPINVLIGKETDLVGSANLALSRIDFIHVLELIIRLTTNCLLCDCRSGHQILVTFFL